MTTAERKQQLLDLATAEFGGLTIAEAEICKALATGEWANFSVEGEDSIPYRKLLAQAQIRRGAARTILASRLAWLCTDREVAECVTFRGLRVKGLKVEGKWNLAQAAVGFPLEFVNCLFVGALDFSQAEFKALALRRSQVIDTTGRAEVLLNLRDTTVRESLDLSGSLFLNTGKGAVCIDRAEVTGSVSLSNEFTAEGYVNISGMSVGGIIVCSNGKFHNPGGDALYADNTEIKGNFFLSDGFTAEGRVSISGMSVGGQIDCHGGKFHNPGGDALYANNTEIKGNFFLSGGFTAKGRVSISEMSVGGQINCDGGKFHNPSYGAIYANNTEIKGDFFLRDGFTAKGRVSISGMSVGGMISCSSGEFYNLGGDAIDANSTEIRGDFFLSDGLKAHGRVRISGMSVGGIISCSNSKFHNPFGDAIYANSTEIKGDFYLGHPSLSDRFTARGRVGIAAVTLNGNLYCGGGSFSNPNNTALDAEGLNVEGDVYLGSPSNSFKIAGKVSLQEAKIDDSLYIGNWKYPDKDEAELNQGDKSVSLDLTFARIGTLSIPNGTLIDFIHRLDLYDFTFLGLGNQTQANSSFWKQWLSKQRKYTPQPYEQVAQVLRASGHEEEAIQILIAKQDRRYESIRLNYYDLLNWHNWKDFFRVASLKTSGCILKHGIAYGYDAKRAFLWGLIPLIVGTISFYDGYRQNFFSPVSNQSAYETPEPTATGDCWLGLSTLLAYIGVAYETPEPTATGDPPDLAEDYPNFQPFLYSLDTLIPIVDLHQEAYWLPDADKGINCKTLEIRPFFHFSLNCGAALRWYLWLHIILGWIVTSLAVAGFTGLVRNEK